MAPGAQEALPDEEPDETLGDSVEADEAPDPEAGEDEADVPTVQAPSPGRDVQERNVSWLSGGDIPRHPLDPTQDPSRKLGFSQNDPAADRAAGGPKDEQRT